MDWGRLGFKFMLGVASEIRGFSFLGLEVGLRLGLEFSIKIRS